jgi:hypothetical protein
MNAEDDLVVIYVSQGPLAAEVAKGKLESLGISAMLRYEAIGRVLGLTVDGLGRVEVLVSAAEADQAREALKEMPDGLDEAEQEPLNDPRSE